ncbi:MAG: hypothetical protein GF320_01295 [Armatimonadia bacterium]|nr:hypothetical protein [Armatimonadia bacterium]
MPKAAFHLTVSEGKRLVAKAVAAMPEVRRAIENGTVVICKGSTNAYVVEEVLGETIDKPMYLTGNTQPSRGAAPMTSARLPDVVLERGQRRDDVTAIEAAADLKPEDVLIKGANALSPDRRMAGVLVGDPTGGTVGNTAGHVIGKGATQITPVGLEKTIGGDLWEIASRVNGDEPVVGSMPRLWISQGQIVTEIEALELLAGVEAAAMSAGGINGAEGSTWLLVSGAEKAVGSCLTLIDGILGEPAFAG